MLGEPAEQAQSGLEGGRPSSLLGLGSFDGDLGVFPPGVSGASFDGDMRGVESLGGYAFVLDRGGSADSADGTDNEALIHLRNNISASWGPDVRGQLTTIESAHCSVDGWTDNESPNTSAPVMAVAELESFERAISEGMDQMIISAVAGAGGGHGHSAGQDMHPSLDGIVEEGSVGGNPGQYQVPQYVDEPDVAPGYHMNGGAPPGYMNHGPNHNQPYLGGPNPHHLTAPLNGSVPYIDPSVMRREIGGPPPPEQHDLPRYPGNSSSLTGAPPQPFLDQQRRASYGDSGQGSPVMNSPSHGSPLGRSSPRGRGAPLPGGALLPPILKRRLSKVGAAGIGAVMALPVPGGSPQESQMDEEELELFILQNSGDESEEAKAARRKLQNRLAQRRRRKRNSMCASMSNIYDSQMTQVAGQFGGQISSYPDPAGKTDDVDPAAVRRRRKSSDFASDEERLEWRRAQNREAKRRYRERRKSESVAGASDPMATLAFLEELRMLQSQTANAGGGEAQLHGQPPMQGQALPRGGVGVQRQGMQYAAGVY